MLLLIISMTLLKLLIRMTLASPTLLLSIIKNSISICTTCERKYQEMSSSIILEVMNWIFYIFAPIIWILILYSAEILQGALYVPKWTWELIWHPDGRSIWRMLSDPEGKLDRKDDFNYDSHRQRNRVKMHSDPRRLRRKWRRHKNDTSYQKAGTHLMDKGPPGRIVGYDSNLCMFSYYQLD